MSHETYDPSVREYYRNLAAGNDWFSFSGNLHGGYYDDEHTTLSEAIVNTQRVIADHGDVGPGDRVLDVGCGVGGPAVWLAEERDAEVVGINITEGQLEVARERAAKSDASDRIEFRHDDYTVMETIEDDSMDVAFCIEALHYAEDKQDVFEQAHRVLDDDGRITFGDGFKTERNLDPKSRELLDEVNERWKLPNLAHVDDIREDLEAAGFTDIQFHDAHENVMPWTRNIARIALVFNPVGTVLSKVGLISQAHVDAIVGYRPLYKLSKREVTTYGIFSARVE
ncbi:hypothetical protein BRC81_09650 [Halobacteriales archaeon QS_1_68_20]|nr:MAG: hypothetical protein BRC81_09650 [Halobacteriales archaeon QS_1_68_20]